jgi:ABC-type transporter Mla maintaining outer membrane lipid asymmetry permease subunit MlaE
VRVAQVNAGRDAVVVTAQHPIVVGLTVLGRAGAAVTAAIPDHTRAG